MSMMRASSASNMAVSQRLLVCSMSLLRAARNTSQIHRSVSRKLSVVPFKKLPKSRLMAGGRPSLNKQQMCGLLPHSRVDCLHLTMEQETSGKLEETTLVQHLSTDNQGSILKVTWTDGTVSRYNTPWLRFNCHCPRCKQPHTEQKLVSIGDFPSKLSIHSATLQNDGSSCISLRCSEEDGHKCILPTDWLRQQSYSPEDLELSARLRDVKFLEGPIKPFNWEDITSSEDSTFAWLDYLNVYGLTLVKNVPVTDEAVVEVARMVGPVQETLYGMVFDVKTEDKPINVAYSSVGLGFHVDLAYYESPPGLQLLHCLKFDKVVSGGDNIFIDSFHVAEELRAQHPHHFDSLTRIPATFQKFHFKRANPAAYIYQRPHININHKNQITAVTWSPPFEGPLFVPEEDVEPYYAAYREFCTLLETSDKVVSHRLYPGDCAVFNNRRILHGRSQFEQNGGARHLKGCYVNIDDFRSKIQYLHEKRRTGQLSRRVGNQCLL